MKKHLLSALFIGVLTGAAPVMAQNLAVVDGEPIPQARYDFFLNRITQSGQQKTAELEEKIKEELIRRAVYAQEAKKQGLDKTPDFKNELDIAQQTFLIRSLLEKQQSAFKITDADVKKEYDAFVSAAQGTEYKVAHILFKDEAAAKAASEQLSKDASKFAALAKEQSIDPGSAQNGGELGWSKPESFVPEFATALSAMKKNEISKTPVKSDFGWHILKLNDTRQAKIPKLEEIKPQIEQSLREKHLQEYTEALYKKASIK